ncbi:unnamed protein product [Taenia asiatica]|uniref:Uncharacterized protein n=1 Tax=Taenia asiatica TaxID=60517 RepID=A0A0R3W8C0_TAEAS|nr:unnamed protein product [Taenia asiatica]
MAESVLPIVPSSKHVQSSEMHRLRGLSSSSNFSSSSDAAPAAAPAGALNTDRSAFPRKAHPSARERRPNRK